MWRFARFAARNSAKAAGKITRGSMPTINSHPQDMSHVSEIAKRLLPKLGVASTDNVHISDEHKPYVRTVSDSEKRNGRQKAARVLPYLHLCIGCGKKADERHHKDGDPLNNKRDNIVPLCAPCHQLAHGKYPRRAGAPNSTTSWAWRNPYATD
jgi:5-methylcytosine-specific restriction endonuclease McrA